MLLCHEIICRGALGVREKLTRKSKNFMSKKVLSYFSFLANVAQLRYTFFA
jgi:hypothetical protein